MSAVDIDHTSFAVHDARSWAARLRRELGATPIAGETLPEFRYLLMHIGGATDGARLELLEPNGPGFLERFLSQHGEGPHHITFTVPDLRTTLSAVRDLGLPVLGEDLTHAPWREAFIPPDHVHGVVVQLAQTDRDFPSPRTLMATRERPLEQLPSNRGATDPHWWTGVWDADPQTQAVLGPTYLNTTDLRASEQLFGGVLGGQTHEFAEGICFAWPRSSLVVRASTPPGVTAIAATNGPDKAVRIGAARIGGSTHA